MSKLCSGIWRRVIFLIGILLLSQNAYSDGGVIANTKNLVQENVEKVKASAKELQSSLQELAEKVQELPQEASDILSGSQDEANNLLSSLLDINDGSGLKDKMDQLKGLKEKFKEIAEKAKSEGQGKTNGIVALTQKIDTQVRELVQHANNVLTLYYTMPIGIRSSNLHFELAVDTLKYVRTDSTPGSTKGQVAMDAHAYWTLPWTITDGPVTVGFRGENIVLKGEGASKIMLYDENTEASLEYISYTLSKDKVCLDLHKDSYVEVDCNGFSEMYLKGRVRFASKIMTPAAGTDTAVHASFEVYVKDLNDMLFETQIDQPFFVSVTDSVIYKAYGLVADFSTQRNAENFQFPEGYTSPFERGNDQYWTGFAIKELSVDLTHEFPDFPLDSAGAYNMLIDETGVSGWFKASVTAGKDKGNANTKKEHNNTIEAEFSDISVGLAHGDICGGSLGGTLTIKPFTKKGAENADTLKLKIEGKMCSVNGHLNFDLQTRVEADWKYKLPIIDATWITIGQGTSVSFSKTYDTTDVNNPKFIKKFLLNLNGQLDVDNKLVKIDGLKFEGMQFSNLAPKFKGGKFSLNSIDMPSLHGLPFGIQGMDVNSKNNEAIITPSVYLQLIGKESKEDAKQGVSVEAKFDLVSDIEKNWKIKGLRLKKIDIDVNYSAFRLKGVIEGFRDDKVYGDGFHGKLGLSMKTPPISADAETYFGKTSYMPDGKSTNKPYHYWYAFANVNLPSGTIIFPPAVMLTSVSLAVYSKMNYEFSKEKCEITKVWPDKALKFGFKAGAGLCVAQDNLVNAKVSLGMDFSESGGIKQITLDGAMSLISKDKNDGFLVGTLGCKYDFENEILSVDAEASPGSSIKKFVDGSAKLKLRTYPDKWYLNVGSVAEPCSLSFMGLASARSYLMLGDSVPTSLPPLDPYICSKFNITQSTATSSDHSEEFSDGTGFAFGIALSVDCHLNKFIYADLVFKGGTDLLVVRKPNFTCEGSKYRASGRVYVYLEAGAGIKVRKKKFEIVEFEALADLEGELPKPIYINGRLDFRYRVLGGLIKGHAHAHYETGTHCTWNADTGGFEYKTNDGILLNVQEDEAAQDSNGNILDSDTGLDDSGKEINP